MPVLSKWPYATSAWKNRTRPAFLATNAICQHIDDRTGRQCDRPAVIVHHL